jgi:CBS domain-containing protein
MKSTVKDIMTTQVIAVRTSTPFKEMAVRLRKDRVSAFPVVDDEGKVVGIVSETDMLPKETPDRRNNLVQTPGVGSQILYLRDEKKADAYTAADLMTGPAVTVGPDDSVDHAARLMYLRRVKRLPVVDADGTLVGIISRADVLSVFDRPDEEIRQEIIDDLALVDPQGDPSWLTVTVKDGVVTLEGTPVSAAAGRAIVMCARLAQGVVTVRDRLHGALSGDSAGPGRPQV